MERFKKWITSVVLCLGLAVVARADEHDHHDHAGHGHRHLTEKDIQMPTDYATAVARIKKCRGTLADEIRTGHLDAAQEPIDEATIILNKVMTLARDSGVPKAQWQEINVAAKDLKKRLSDLHAAIETRRKVDFKAVAVPIDQAIRRLEFVARAPSNVLTR
jgi:hypothetical protein